MYRGKVLFIDSADTSFTTRLRELGFECHYKDVNYEQMFDIAQDYVGYIIRSRFVIDKILIDASKQLKFIANSEPTLFNSPPTIAIIPSIKTLINLGS